VRLPEELECRAIDSGVRHAVTGAEYEAARAAAFMGYKLICDWERLPVRLDTSGRIARWSDPRWNGYLSSLQPSLFRSRYEARLPEAISGAEYLRLAEVHADPFTALHEKTVYPVRAAARYAVEENHRIELFVALALGAGSPGANEDRFRLMGEMMYQSHAAYTECGLGCDATDKIVELVRREGPESGLYGAKITGGGAGGTVAVLGRKGSNEAFGRVVDGYAALRGARPHVFEGSSPGADRFGIEVVEA
jgi:L-arabinokinase